MRHGHSLYILLFKLASIIEGACLLESDISFAAYAMLASMVEHPDGIERKTALALLPQNEARAAIDELESTELIEFARSSHDRRAISLKASPKGKARLDMIDEGVCIALIDSSNRLSEAFLEQLETRFKSIAQQENPDARVETIIPSAALRALVQFKATTKHVCAQARITSLQTALLAALSYIGDPLDPAQLARAIGVPTSAAMLHMELLEERGEVRLSREAGPYSLTETGEVRLGDVTERLSPAFAPIERSCEQIEHVEDVLELLLYLFPVETSPMPAEPGQSALVGIAPATGASSPADRARSLSGLLSALSKAFAYPDRQTADALTQAAAIEQFRALVAGAGARSPLPEAICQQFEHASGADADTRIHGLRQEYTRLFYTFPIQVKLAGSDWVRANRTQFSIQHGERAAVGLEYRKLGLKNKPGTTDPYDSLVTELDFLSYLAFSEARAIQLGDAGSAREWERLRREFGTRHFNEFATGAAQAIIEKTQNPFLAFYATVLGIAASLI